ncbi:hypothetical protein CFP65_6372 [Kitasatospora sp. MMS16-BH015]|uniref:hypothetical protein n=1 Tax=Kitasatospora sp. MMS16-BH015 TaxID=2018025 RepID=UPI000CA29F8F|nr:hypothetical protein [Kitasatospora sp. MMS16-BH015]AUG81028.1 hypothetical protein CFP65_6372 [Kitasatospora sp. MMS16-BH015]
MTEDRRTEEVSPVREILKPDASDAHFGVVIAVMASAVIGWMAGAGPALFILGISGCPFLIILICQLAMKRPFRTATRRAYLYTFGIFQWF